MSAVGDQTPIVDASEATRQTARVLVVDDNRLNRLKLARGLEGQGHAVSVAENGREALNLLRSERFDFRVGGSMLISDPCTRS